MRRQLGKRERIDVAVKDFSQVVIEIPGLLPKETSSNWRGHWAVRMRAVKQARTDTFLCTLNANPPRLVFNKAAIKVSLVIPSRRHIRDSDNTITSLKPFIDGIIDAGLIEDDSPDHLAWQLPIMYEITKAKPPAIIITVEGMVK